MAGKLNQIRTEIDTRSTPDGRVLVPRYTLCFDNDEREIHPGDDVSLAFTYVGGASCTHCAAPVRKPFAGGYCYTCFTTLARCDLCIMSPERCHLHLGTCREPQWGEEHCQQPHFVYLAVSSGPKVGITRAPRLERRWVDQGAKYAMAIAKVPTRRAAGALEVALKRHVSDRTDWRKMVSGHAVDTDLGELARQLKAIVADFNEVPGDGFAPGERAEMAWLENPQQVRVDYPVAGHPEIRKLKVNQDNPQLRDNLLGFKGSYVLLRSGVIPFSDLTVGDVAVEVLPALPPNDELPQMNLF